MSQGVGGYSLISQVHVNFPGLFSGCVWLLDLPDKFQLRGLQIGLLMRKGH